MAQTLLVDSPRFLGNTFILVVNETFSQLLDSYLRKMTWLGQARSSDVSVVPQQAFANHHDRFLLPKAGGLLAHTCHHGWQAQLMIPSF